MPFKHHVRGYAYAANFLLPLPVFFFLKPVLRLLVLSVYSSDFSATSSHHSFHRPASMVPSPSADHSMHLYCFHSAFSPPRIIQPRHFANSLRKISSFFLSFFCFPIPFPIRGRAYVQIGVTPSAETFQTYALLLLLNKQQEA